MGFEGQLSDADKACKHEREEVERDEPTLYRLMFQYVGTDADGFVRASWERLAGVATTSRWELLCSGRGTDEATSIKAMRSNLRELRARRVRHVPMAAWSTDFEVVS